MLAKIFTNRLFIGALAFFILCVGGSLFYSHQQQQKDKALLVETEERVKQWNERQNEQPRAETPVVDVPEQPIEGENLQADGTFHAEPDEIEVQEIHPIESTSALIPSVPPEVVVSEEKVDEQAPYHPHDDLSPEEHQRVHAELKQYQAQLDDLNHRFAENLAALRARHITPKESREFLDRASEELALIKENMARLNGE